MNSVTVKCNGKRMDLADIVAKEFGYRDGEELSDREYWVALSANVTARTAALQLTDITKKAGGEFDRR